MFRNMGAEQGQGDVMIAAKGDQMSAGGEDGARFRFDGRRDGVEFGVVDRAITPVDDRHVLERINAGWVLRINIEDCGGTAERLWPESGTGAVRGGAIEGDAPDDGIDAGKITRITPPHEGKRAGKSRLEGRADFVAAEGVVSLIV